MSMIFYIDFFVRYLDLIFVVTQWSEMQWEEVFLVVKRKDWQQVIFCVQNFDRLFFFFPNHLTWNGWYYPGEMIVGPMRALFMDEISNGLDSSTTYQIVACLQQLAHITDATVVVSLLQPAPETFDLFDDIILMAEGKIVYHGARTGVLEFFQGFGFRCPERKGIADFLQEVKKKHGFYSLSFLEVPTTNHIFIFLQRLSQEKIKHNTGLVPRNTIPSILLINYQSSSRNHLTDRS